MNLDGNIGGSLTLTSGSFNFFSTPFCTLLLQRRSQFSGKRVAGQIVEAFNRVTELDEFHQTTESQVLQQFTEWLCRAKLGLDVFLLRVRYNRFRSGYQVIQNTI